jgi:hypothetical protein
MLKQPSKQTIKKYGLTLKEWNNIADSQNQVCYICLKLPPARILCVDHLHIKGFKKMKPEDKKKYVRGLLCRYCNLRVASKAINLEKAIRLVAYLQAFETKLKQ